MCRYRAYASEDSLLSAMVAEPSASRRL